MDVTRKNFYELLPNLKKSLSEAEFITVDLEFTGLTSGGRELDPMPFDTPQQYYDKVHQKALDFLPLQLGVCIFQYDSSGNKFTYQAYNFYIFPFSKLKGFPNCIFQCQNSSISFLSSCGFDFNKAFGEGIPFLTQPEEDKLKTSIEERQQKMGRENTKESSDVPVPEDLQNLFQAHMKKIKDFLEDSSENKADCLILDRCNGFMRKLLYQEARKEFGETVHLETCDDSNFAMKILRGGGEEFKRLREEEKKKIEWKEFDEAVGLSHLIKAISESGKLLVAHNCFLDICHLVNRFRYPLPPKYENFKEIVHHIFPRIIDTKFMSTAQQFKDLISVGSLGQLLDTLSETPFDMPTIEGNVEGHSYSNLIDKSHEGGYDAFITGKCFLAMCQYLAKVAGKTFNNMESISDIVSKFENRLYLMRIQDVPYLTLGGPDTKPPRNHVFHLSFPREWRQYEVVELFKPFGPVFVSFINDRSAYVALHKRDQAKTVLKTMTGNNTYKVTSFSTYQKQNDRKSPPSVLPASPSLDLLRKRKTESPDESSGTLKKQRNLDQVVVLLIVDRRYVPAELLSTQYLLGIIMNRYYLDWLWRPVENFASEAFAITVKMLLGLVLMSAFYFVIWPKRSIDPIPEETEVDSLDEGEGNQRITSKEFPESEVWG
ncbi:Poly(A)-specific ribonuclease PARN [Frankliniella fusca]|uniref:Poly(A)-specific ribonuclease PARN n=1 Tax=Frankliniella fusca TaxID=407009 RepID=A0AAE1I2F9_9NEOP|nr:Poly(A)-specific ribonuclease PARN [Frankliniella fusca]